MEELRAYWLKEPPVHVMLAKLARAAGLVKDTTSTAMNEFESALMGQAEHFGVRAATTLPLSVNVWLQQVTEEQKHAAN